MRFELSGKPRDPCEDEWPPSTEETRATKKVKHREEAPLSDYRDRLISVEVTMEEIATGDGVKIMQFSVVVNLLGRSIGYKSLCLNLSQLWNMNAAKVVDMGCGYFLVQFAAELLRRSQPWMIVEKRKRQMRRNSENNIKENIMPTGGRFNVLQDANLVHQNDRDASLALVPMPLATCDTNVGQGPWTFTKNKGKLVTNGANKSEQRQQNEELVTKQPSMLDPRSHIVMRGDMCGSKNSGQGSTRAPEADRPDPDVEQRLTQAFVLLEPHISGKNADISIRRIGYPNSHGMEANGFSGGIWLLWDGFSHEASVSHLVRYQSDHRPLLLNLCSFSPSMVARPFRFIRAWMSHEKHNDFVIDNWGRGDTNVVYKLVTKTIATRLKKLMLVIVGPTQSSFVTGRHITDNIVIAQEAIHSMRSMKGNHGVIALKVDLEKVYDRVSWAFLYDTLNEAGLSEALIDVIMTCVSTSTMQIMWNGDMTDSFTPSRGLRQVCPLSPYLFVLCIERLAHGITKSVEAGDWKPFKKFSLLRILHMYWTSFAQAQDAVACPREEGGLGLRNLHLVNNAFGLTL
ncbi:hypothetical protein SASPL_131950 [Salvia splendens]|uniref:Reverse transcriptase domain-containing protein n=1 Tax=Salvia splendens TaxID=180675 RepID=A0A8X8X8S2_SALSN|nr:hypothetical protein SASPL_131950 [Salvia splendens]